MNRWMISALIVVVATGVEAAPDRVEAPPERAYSAFSEDRARRFDFWIGVWDVNLRMKQADLSFADTIRARASIYRILGGKAVLELWDSGPIKGYSLRYFDPSRDKWVLWLSWPGPNAGSVSSLEGEFRHGRGSFRNSYTNAQGEEIQQRYSFNDITPFSLRWDDLFSKDGGKTWAKNWRMEFNRVAVDPEWPIDRSRVPTFVDGGHCNAEPYRPYEVLADSWVGKDSRLDAYRVLDGCAVLGFLRSGDREEFLFVTYTGGSAGWEVDVLDDRAESPLVRYRSTSSWSSLEADGGRLELSVDGDRLEYRRDGVAVSLDRAR